MLHEPISRHASRTMNVLAQQSVNRALPTSLCFQPTAEMSHQTVAFSDPPRSDERAQEITVERRTRSLSGGKIWLYQIRGCEEQHNGYDQQKP